LSRRRSEPDSQGWVADEHLDPVRERRWVVRRDQEPGIAVTDGAGGDPVDASRDDRESGGERFEERIRQPLPPRWRRVDVGRPQVLVDSVGGLDEADSLAEPARPISPLMAATTWESTSMWVGSVEPMNSR